MESEAEVRVLLALCRANLTGHRPDEDLVFPSSDAGWLSTLACAASHGLTGLLFRTVAHLDCISAAALQAIRSSAHAQIARSCYLANELVDILTVFRSLDIDAQALKGPVLAARFYGNISDREFSDLDILVHPADLDRACLVLGQRGYRTDPKSFTTRRLVREGQNHVVFVREDDGSTVELHWALNANSEQVSLEDTGVWSRVQSVRLFNRPVLSLGVADTLLYLCIHGSKHRWCRLKWLIDIAYVLRSGEPIDWDALVSRAKRTGSYRMLLVGLGLASGLLGSDIPPVIAKQVSADQVAASLVEQIQFAVWSDTPVDNVEAMIYELRSRERFQDRFVLWCRLLRRIFRPTHADGQFDHEPARSRFTALFKRPMRLYRTYGLAWVKPVFRLR